METYVWEPGNSTRYELTFGRWHDGKLFLAWMSNAGGGKFLVFDGYLHHTYLQEKMSLNTADADAILQFLENRGCSVGYSTSREMYGKDYYEAKIS